MLYHHLQLSIISDSSSRRSSSSFPGSRSISASNLPPEISHINFSKSSSTERGGFPVEAELSRRVFAAIWDEEGPDISGGVGSEEGWVGGRTRLSLGFSVAGTATDLSSERRGTTATAALLAGRSCRKLLGPSGFTAATAAGCISTALCFGANLGDETTLTTDGFTFTLGLATRDRKYLVKS